MTVAMASSLRQRLTEIPGARELFPDVWLLPGRTDSTDLSASSLLFLQREPLLVDAGMAIETATALRASGLVARLHLTHMHLDHRSRQDWFVTENVSCPDIERPAFVDWDAFLTASGFANAGGFDFHAWRKARFHVDLVPGIRGLADGDRISVDELDARVLALPGHTHGHSGLWLPDLRAALVTDYDMEPFGPWYGNPVSDLDAYVATLEALLKRDDIDWFVTSHQRGMLDRETFREEGRRYLDMIESRTMRLVELLDVNRPSRVRELLGKGVFYSTHAFGRNPVFALFENQMTRKHLARAEAAGLACREAEGWLRCR